MTEYHKIPTVWQRDPATKFRTLIEGQWATPELGYLSELDWVWTEKVDGTNIRLWLNALLEPQIGGKTDDAQIPSFLLPRLNEIGAKLKHELLVDMILYGEGYGAKIQKGGGNYRPDQDFILFDVLAYDADMRPMWLERENVEDIAKKIGVHFVPIVGHGTLPAAIKVVRSGALQSQWGSAVKPEGLVMRPRTELRSRRGERIIGKIKARDFA